MIAKQSFGRTGHMSTRAIFGSAALWTLSQRHADRVFGLAWSPDGERLVSGSGFKDGMIILWSKEGENLTSLDSHTSSVYRIKWKPDGTMFASASYDRTARIWKDQKEYAVIEGHPGPVLNLAWSPDGKTLVSSSMGAIGFWYIE